MVLSFVSKIPIAHIPKTQNATFVKSVTYSFVRSLHHSARLSAISPSSSRRRPILKNLHQPSAILKPLAVNGRRSIFIQTEETPNTNALKFLPNQSILPPGLESSFIEYLNPKSTLKPPYPSLLASKLMSNTDITSVFYGTNFITVTKSPDADWMYIKPEIFSLITEALTSGAPIVNVSKNPQQLNDSDVVKDSLSHDPNDSEVVGMIKELLELRIRPAIQEDGGDIDFKGFQDGQVLLKLRGACRTCDSSTVTLKNGIEAMLMHYIEEVKGVKQVLDEEEEVALREFARFEEKLHQQKDSEEKQFGKTPTASSTPGLSGPKTS